MVKRLRQWLQGAACVSLRWSFRVFATMIFSAEHAGQENRITYPALVPFISGFNGSFVIDIRSGGLFSVGTTTISLPGSQDLCAKKVSKVRGPCSVTGILMGADLLSKPFMLYVYLLSLNIE
nr:hypothetical protein [uncultured Methanoregula sp.]